MHSKKPLVGQTDENLLFSICWKAPSGGEIAILHTSVQLRAAKSHLTTLKRIYISYLAALVYPFSVLPVQLVNAANQQWHQPSVKAWRLHQYHTQGLQKHSHNNCKLYFILLGFDVTGKKKKVNKNCHPNLSQIKSWKVWHPFVHIPVVSDNPKKPSATESLRRSPCGIQYTLHITL